MKNLTKISSIIFLVAMLLIVSAPKRAEAGACPVLTWGGQSWNTNWSPTTKKLSGTAVFNNWAGTQYNITINWEGPKPGCVTQAEFTKSMNWLYNSDAQTFWNKNVDNWTQYLTCGNTHTYSRTHVPVAGVCGVANGATYTSAPASGLCGVGTASSVTTNPSTYSWSCSGLYSGSNAQCSANKGNNGQSGGTPPGDPVGGGGSSSVLNDAVCSIIEGSSLANLGDTVKLGATPQGGGPNYSYAWSNVTSSNGSMATVSSTRLSIVSASVIVSDSHTTLTPKACPTIEFALRPVISIIPPITDNTCTLNWEDTGLPEEASCKVYEDGVQTNMGKNSDAKAGKKYQIKCTYTPDGSETSTTTVSAIRACVKNPSLIEI